MLLGGFGSASALELLVLIVIGCLVPASSWLFVGPWVVEFAEGVGLSRLGFG